MEIYQLRAFATAARLGNLTRTAEALHLTQPAITAQIKALEEELGVALFERRPGGITLTRAGELLLQDAEQILTTAGHLQGRARELQGEVTGQLVLGTLGDPESLRLGTLLGVLSEKLPLLEIKTRQGAAEDVREQVAAGLLRGGDHAGGGVKLAGRDSAGLDVGADDIAEDAAEIFMARVADEAPGIGQHTYEAAQQAERRECVQLLPHTVLLVEEPPA